SSINSGSRPAPCPDSGTDAVATHLPRNLLLEAGIALLDGFAEQRIGVDTTELLPGRFPVGFAELTCDGRHQLLLLRRHVPTHVGRIALGIRCNSLTRQHRTAD